MGIIFFSLVIVIISILIINDARLLIIGEKTEGTVYLIVEQHKSIPPYKANMWRRENIPLISFFVNNVKFETRGCGDCNKIGDKVIVIYDPDNPSNAEVYSGLMHQNIYYLVGSIVFLILFVRRRFNNIRHTPSTLL